MGQDSRSGRIENERPTLYNGGLILLSKLLRIRLMARINDNYLKLKAGYLFPEISRRIKAFVAENPDASIIRLGIGDVTEPLPAACVEAMTKAVAEMGRRETFRGYMDDSQGYDWLREKIAAQDFRAGLRHLG
ncbi:MAG: hypothetical protein R3B91_15675 [Planctomycetaceae bacterium]